MAQLKQNEPRWTKSSGSAPKDFFRTEAAGLRWLAETGSLSVVEVLDGSSHALTLRRLHSVQPSATMAREFGRKLAALHSWPTESFGQLPPGAADYYFGPLSSPLALPVLQTSSFGEFYAAARVAPLSELCGRDGSLTPQDSAQLRALCQALESGAADSAHPVRTHGDLWSGNIMWTNQGGTLIDPAACGQHPMADIAMLMMFGSPYLEELLEAYTEDRPLPNAWRDSVGLHQLFGYLVHLHLFGTAYLEPTRQAIRESSEYLGL